MLNRRVIVTQYGGPEALELLEEPVRSPQSGEVRIKLQSAGVALGDVMRREGLFPNSPQTPFTPGYDAVGLVDDVGDGVLKFSKGDRVGVLFQGTGAYSEYLYGKEDDLFQVPHSIDAAEAVAVILNYVTAYQMLHRFAQVSEGDQILIHGAGGGVGTALLELGRLAGVTMYGTASAGKHGIVSQFGATPIDYRKDDFVQVLAKLAPEGMDAVFDPIGGSNWLRSFHTLGRKGRFIGYGFTSVLGGDDSDEWIRAWKSVSETKQTANGHPASVYSITSLQIEKPDWFKEDVRKLFSLLESGKIRPLISHRIPLEEADRAHQLLAEPASVGKVVLIGS